jgi:hypothetical protein
VTIVGARTDGLNGVRWPFVYSDQFDRGVGHATRVRSRSWRSVFLESLVSCSDVIFISAAALLGLA